MSEPDLQRVEEVFQAAVDLPDTERRRFLDDACDGDAGLLARVEALLVRLEEDASLTMPATPVGSAGAGLTGAAVTEGPGSVIGRYKLLQVIGEGGFGVVYRAEQQEPIVRKVALKIIKLGMDTREVVARFEAERQALALMDHPNIARVLDGGATASGRPYFVMELVRGLSITEYCDKNDLPTRARLELFEAVCRAVQHAHQKGVIHRDIKPSNVLVTLHDGRAMPKVIDFGVAKAMYARLTEKTLFTRYEQFIGTPAYMSPEQAEMSALDVDTRTDIYSLGVLLYELLTGTTPFDTQSLMKAGLAEIQRVIREEEPVRPSQRISTAGDAGVARRRGLDSQGLSRLLRGDLDWIVLKAMEKERGRRYATASELADDVVRHMKREPVVAGPPGAAYRARKFLARNRTVVLTVTVIALALVGGIVSTTLSRIDAERNAQRAEEQTRLTAAALDFLVATLSLADPEIALDPDLTVRALLDETAAGVAEAFAGLPWAEARVRATIGRAYTSLSEMERAEPHLRRAVELIEAMEAERAAGRVPAGAPRFDQGDFYDTLWTLTNVCFNLERADAFAVSSRAREVGLGHVATDHPALAEALRDLTIAVGQHAWSNTPDAMKDVPGLHEKARALADETLRPGDPLWPIVADTFLTCGYMVWYTPHEALAEQFNGEALRIQRRELPPDHPDVATTVSVLVGVLNRLGRSVEAEALIRSSVASLRRVHRPDAFPVAAAESVLGDNLVRQGRFDEAEPILLNSHAVVLATVTDESNYMAVESLTRLVALYEAWGRPEMAADFRDSLARTCAESRHIAPWTLATCLDPEHAELRAALERVREQCGGVSYLVAPGAVHAPDLAPAVRAVVALRAKLLPDPTEPRAAALARLLLGWANALDPQRDVEARRLMATEAVAILEAWEERLPIDLAEGLAVLATTAPAERSTGEARRLARDAWRLMENAETRGLWFTIAAELRIGRVLMEQGLFAEAEALLVPGYERFVEQLGPYYNDTQVTRGLIVELYERWGKPEMADRYREIDR